MPYSNQPLLRTLLGVAVLLASASAWGQSEPLAASYVKPDTNFRQYTQFLVEPLNLEDTRLIPPPWVENADPHEWEFTARNRNFLRDTFAEAVQAGIESEGRFKVVTEPTPGTLQIEVHLISLTPWASREEQNVETRGSGTLTFEAHVRDAATAELLAVYEGTQQVGEDYQENTQFNKVTDLTEHFTSWGRNLSRRLAAVQAQ